MEHNANAERKLKHLNVSHIWEKFRRSTAANWKYTSRKVNAVNVCGTQTVKFSGGFFDISPSFYRSFDLNWSEVAKCEIRTTFNCTNIFFKFIVNYCHQLSMCVSCRERELLLLKSGIINLLNAPIVQCVFIQRYIDRAEIQFRDSIIYLRHQNDFLVAKDERAWSMSAWLCGRRKGNNFCFGVVVVVVDSHLQFAFCCVLCVSRMLSFASHE